MTQIAKANPDWKYSQVQPTDTECTRYHQENYLTIRRVTAHKGRCKAALQHLPHQQQPCCTLSSCSTKSVVGEPAANQQPPRKPPLLMQPSCTTFPLFMTLVSQDTVFVMATTNAATHSPSKLGM
jgi:hypothetical protein